MLSAGSLTVSQHLEQGTQHLRSGSLGEALNHYHAAIGFVSIYFNIICEVGMVHI